MQRSLFSEQQTAYGTDIRPIVHTGDPATSAEAAEKVTSSGRRGAHCRMVLDMVRRRPGCTAVELWEGANDLEQLALVEMQEVRRRLTDLLADGHVVQGAARACSVRGTSMVTWEVAACGSGNSSSAGS